MSVVEPGKAVEVYTHRFYGLLEAAAKLEPITVNEDGTGPASALVWRGKLMELFASMGVSSIYYTRIRRALMKYDCVTYLQRGSRSYDSVLVLNHPPPENFTSEDLTHVPGSDSLTGLAERVADLEHKVKGLENWREGTGGINIGEALAEYERRLLRIETGGTNGKEKSSG